ncbi:hypothetical protein [Bacillus sp. CHD6a]|uniref:hypothetical protein n=1 Tax=Bacillus sp. CHD6a TaxID=1643452 RepID=UPI0006CD7BA5|nr:hypothetical protein [Bacillus sp. CHD6a]KPB03868.1 hypothetical protein AAV98_14665 [Bacillus sp. CHD6a]
MKIALLHAEISDLSYNMYKLEAYATVPISTMDNKEPMMNYSIGAHSDKVHSTNVTVLGNQRVIKFDILLTKHSGLLAEGLTFQLSLSSSYITEDYHIGGRFGDIVLEESIIKHHLLYLQHLKLTGSILTTSSYNKKSVRFVCFNESYSLISEARFKEYIPYSKVELWEYTVNLNEDNLTDNLFFYVELIGENTSYKDNNFQKFYKLWEHVPRLT